MLGEDLNLEKIKKMDDKIISLLENDTKYDKNIYLISSNGDPRYKGQIKPFLHLFNKYFNFNFIESASVLVRTHQDVTTYNAPLILGMLNILTFNLIPQYKNSIIKGDDLDPNYKFKEEVIYKLNQIDFSENGELLIEGVYFIRGIPCADYSDLNYTLDLLRKSLLKIYPVYQCSD